MSRKRKTIHIVLAVIIVAALCFIWINSIMPGDVSGGFSRMITVFAQKLFGDNIVITEHRIRKLAHGLEFALLGVVFSLFWFEKLKNRVVLIEFCGLFVALCDETIQLFSDGRTSQVKDIWIDFTGFTAGVILIGLIYVIFGRHNKKE